MTASPYPRAPPQSQLLLDVTRPHQEFVLCPLLSLEWFVGEHVVACWYRGGIEM